MKIFSKKVIFIAIIAALGSSGVYYYFIRTPRPAYEFVEARRGTIIQQVSVTGRVKPAKSVDLAFEKSGKVAHIYIGVNDKVKAGEVLAVLQNDDVRAQLAQTQAAVESAEAQLRQYEAALSNQQAKLEESKRGTRPEQIQIAESQAAGARISLESAQRNVIVQLKSAYTSADDAVRNQVDQLFVNPRSATPQLNLNIGDIGLKSDIESRRLALESTLSNWDSSLMSLTLSSDLNAAIRNAKNNLSQTSTFLDKVALAVNVQQIGGVTAATLASYKTAVSTARANVNVTVTSVTTVEGGLKTAQSNLELAENELALSRAGSTQEQTTAQTALVEQAQANVATQKAQVKQAEASVQLYQSQLKKTFLYAPFDGIVTRQDAKIGEIAPGNAPLVSLISGKKLEIEANVPEADITKVKIGDEAAVTLDAYGSDVTFEVKVGSIDPTEIIIEGVATYRVTFQFIREDSRPKPGMTANLDIMTAKKENVIAIPQRAVATKNNEKYVDLLIGGNIINEVKVKTGLRGWDGNVEIVEGISEGDKVVTAGKQ